VKIVAADTARTPVDLGSYSSRVTFMAGNAALEAARDARRKLDAAAAKKSGIAEDKLTIDEAIRLAVEPNETLMATGTYAPPEAAQGGKFKGAGVGPSPAYSYGAQVAEVTVDTETGEVRVDRITAAHDCGKAINPINVEGQVIGSVWMGLGQAVQEEMVWEGGRLMNPGLLEYRSASTLESPPIDPIIVESNDPEGPFGAKEAGEGSLAATIPAVAHAIYDAVGVWIDTLPITPEKILKAMKDKKTLEDKELDDLIARH
jgi:CO/xanthine dehydrogenase Mo-binding subunit